MNAGRQLPRIAAAAAALAVNVALAGGLASLAKHYEAQAAPAYAQAAASQTADASGALRCRPAPARAG